MAVDPALLKEFMLDDLYNRAAAASSGALPQDSERALAECAERLGAGDSAIARAGYCTRVAETDRFERAREGMPWLRSLLDEQSGDRAAVAATLALGEPGGKPSPDNPAAMTWKVPGPGGHVRYFLAVRWTGGTDEDSRRRWLYGFFLRCCEEAAETRAPSVRRQITPSHPGS